MKAPTTEKCRNVGAEFSALDSSTAVGRGATSATDIQSNSQPQSRFEPHVSDEVIAAHLGITKRRVQQLTRRGTLPGHPVDPHASRKTWRYKISEVEAAICGETKSLVPEFIGPHNDAGSPRGQKGKH